MLIDTFLFSQPHESDLLWVKLNLENNLIDKWILQENAYDLKGNYKGLFANEILMEERFKPFLDKIIVISENKEIYPGQTDENTNFQREGWQRTLCYQTLQKLSPKWVVVSDVDECIDGENETRKQNILNILSKNFRTCHIGRMRYWYQYNSRCYLPNIRVPFVPGPLAVSQIDSLPISRHYNINETTFDCGENPNIFEYSYCFKTPEDIFKKKETYSHSGFDFESVKEGLYLNAWPRSKQRNEPRSQYDFFEIVDLTEDNSPKFVRDNLTLLNSQIIDLNYKQNRQCLPKNY